MAKKFKDTKLIEAYKEYLPFEKVNRELLDKLKIYELNFINKKGTNRIVDFLSNITIGEYEFTMSKNDSYILFNDILGISKEMYDELEGKLSKILPKEFVKTSRPDWGIFPYMMRAICANNKNIDHAKNKQMSDDLCLVYRLLAYTTISYLNHHYYKYLKPHDEAASVAESMTMKYKLKVCGSWYNFIVYRFENDFVKGTTRYDDIRSDLTQSHLNIISDIHVRYRDQYKLSYRLYELASKKDTIHSTTLSAIDNEGEEKLKPITNDITIHTEFIKNSLINPIELINETYIQLISRRNGIDKEVLIDSITKLRLMDIKVLDKFIDVLISFIYNRLQEENMLIRDRKDIMQLIKNVEKVLGANSGKDKTLGYIRDTAEDYILNIVTLKNKKSLRDVYMGLCSYLFLIGVY
jgi:hypothetical protein